MTRRFSYKNICRCCLSLILGGIISASVAAPVTPAARDADSMHGAMKNSSLGAEPLPQAKPSGLAMQVSKYISGNWRIVGNNASGKKLFDGRVMVHLAGGKKFLNIRYKANQYGSLNSSNINMKSRKAFMMLYFKNNKFNLLSFSKSGKIKHYQGRLSGDNKKYIFTSQAFKFGPLRAKALLTINPLSKQKYLEHFYINVLIPGSANVLRKQLVANIVATKMKKHHKNPPHSSGKKLLHKKPQQSPGKKLPHKKPQQQLPAKPENKA